MNDETIKGDLAKVFVAAVKAAGKQQRPEDSGLSGLWAVFLTGVGAGASLRNFASHGQIERALVEMMRETGFKPSRLNVSGGQPPPHE